MRVECRSLPTFSWFIVWFFLVFVRVSAECSEDDYDFEEWIEWIVKVSHLFI